MKKRSFTLVELLVVVGILAILAGLVIPAVVGAKQQGRITQARADMSSLRTAFEGMYRDYNRMAKKNNSSYELGSQTFSEKPSSSGCITIMETSANANYCNVIAELSVPASLSTPSLNKRRIKYLDPRPEYDPSQGPTSGKNPDNTWLDPWGNPYMIRINVDGSEQIVDPSDSTKKLSGRIIIWSLGPDGESGADASGDSGSGDNAKEQAKDNIPGWKDSNWFDRN